MREGQAWERLRKLLDIAQDTCLVSGAFDARSVCTGRLREVGARGTEVLRSLVLAEAHVIADTFEDPSEQASFATKDKTLAHLFEALGLDARLRRHRQPLSLQTKARVVRVLVGEVEKGEGVIHGHLGETVWRQDLLRGLAAAVLQLHAEGGPRQLKPATGLRARTPDAKLFGLLQGGSARAIVARLRAMAKGESSLLEVRGCLAQALSMLRENQMRLMVFVQALQILCQPPEHIFSGKADMEQASLVSAVVDGVLAAGLEFLPIEAVDQLAAVEQSPYLSNTQQEALLDLMMPAGASDSHAGLSLCKSCGNTGLDMQGNYCACICGQKELLREEIASGEEQGELSARARYLQGSHSDTREMSSSISVADHQPVDLPRRPPSPNIRASSPMHGWPSAAADEAATSPRSSMGRSIDTRLLRPYEELPDHVKQAIIEALAEGASIDEILSNFSPGLRQQARDYIQRHREQNLRPWVPTEKHARYHGITSPPYDHTRYVPVLSQSERDDRVISGLCQQPYGTRHRNEALGIDRTRGCSRTRQEAHDDRALQQLFSGDHVVPNVPPETNDYQSRIAHAAVRFRHLASTHDDGPVANQHARTAALLNQTKLMSGGMMATDQARTAALLNQTGMMATDQARTAALLNQTDLKMRQTSVHGQPCW